MQVIVRQLYGIFSHGSCRHIDVVRQKKQFAYANSSTRLFCGACQYVVMRERLIHFILRFIPYFVVISYTVNTSICGKGQLDIAN